MVSRPIFLPIPPGRWLPFLSSFSSFFLLPRRGCRFYGERTSAWGIHMDKLRQLVPTSANMLTPSHLSFNSSEQSLNDILHCHLLPFHPLPCRLLDPCPIPIRSLISPTIRVANLIPARDATVRSFLAKKEDLSGHIVWDSVVSVHLARRPTRC